MISVEGNKIGNLKTKIISRKVNSALRDCDVTANLKEWHKADKTVNNFAVICKMLFALVINKKLGFNSGNSNNKSGAYKKTNLIIENNIVNEQKEHLSNHYSI